MIENKFESIEEVYKMFSRRESIELAYNGKEYFLSSEDTRGNFTIATNLSNDNPIPFDTLDELLDNYKEDGKPLREFILDMEIEEIHNWYWAADEE